MSNLTEFKLQLYESPFTLEVDNQFILDKYHVKDSCSLKVCSIPQTQCCLPHSVLWCAYKEEPNKKQPQTQFSFIKNTNTR